MDNYEIRQMVLCDMEAVACLGRQCYGDFLQESSSALWGKACFGPELSILCMKEKLLCGYLVSYPASAEHIGKLDRPSFPGEAESWYLHDMSISKDFRGMGIATRLYKAARETALRQGLRRSHLVSVQSSAPFWSRFGYRQYEVQDEEAGRALAGYGANAIAMRIDNL